MSRDEDELGHSVRPALAMVTQKGACVQIWAGGRLPYWWFDDRRGRGRRKVSFGGLHMVLYGHTLCEMLLRG